MSFHKNSLNESPVIKLLSLSARVLFNINNEVKVIETRIIETIILALGTPKITDKKINRMKNISPELEDE